jgi:Helicase associated domain
LDWDPYATAWNAKFKRLKAYKKENGDCNVPLRYPEDLELGRWVGNMRNQRRRDKLSEARIQLLDSIGFEWELLDKLRDIVWETQFKALQEYHKQTGNCDVPPGYNDSLLNWVRTQRAKAKNVSLTTDQFRRLDELGFTWDAGADAAWEAQFKTLEAYYRENGDCNVPAEWKQNPMLGRWVSGLRKKRKDGHLTTEQIQRLDKMGFDWDPNDNRWEERFAELKAWAEKKRHCRFPVENSVLGKWVSHQRADRKKKILSPARIKRLDEIGFEWDPIKGSWNDWFIKLEAYQKKNGHCNVPGKAGDGLGNWVVNQRQIRKRGGMPEDRIQLLDSIGFHWDQKAEERQALWDTRFAELKAYKKEYGHCNVPKDGSTLGTWVQAQRRGYKKGTLAEDRTRRLNAIGFVWNTKL